ncbi:MAG: hypothetical protein HUJ93_03965 [Bacteroidales bacterium]|nr:hypothetical protein [Bacteroidales bacterium]
MRRIYMLFIAAAAFFAGCAPEQVPLDSPYVYIEDSEGNSKMDVGAAANDYAVTLYVHTSSRLMDRDVKVSYKAVAGNGLTEGRDFRIKQGTSAELTFAPGIYRMPIHIVWYKAQAFDPAADNTLTFEITECSESDFTIGLLSLGDSHLKTSYTFTRTK